MVTTTAKRTHDNWIVLVVATKKLQQLPCTRPNAYTLRFSLKRSNYGVLATPALNFTGLVHQIFKREPII